MRCFQSVYRSLAIAAVSLPIFASWALAANPSPGDILISNLSGNNIQVYSPSGTLKQTITGTGSTWIGAAVAVAPSGRILTTRRSPAHGVNVFNFSGVEIASFDTPAVTGFPGDVSMFADGTIAVADQSGQVELYAQNGAHLSTLAAPGMSLNVNTTIGPDDTLWVANAYGNEVFHFNRSGTLLGSVYHMGGIGDVIVSPADGSLFFTDNGTTVWHYSAAGAQLGQFSTPFDIHASSIDMAADGTLYITGADATSVYRYTQGGVLQGSFPLSDPQTPTDLTIVPIPEPASLSLIALGGTGVMLTSRRSAANGRYRSRLATR